MTLGAVPGTIQTVTYTGSALGDLAGWSVGSVQPLPSQSAANPGNPILIGAPGYQAGSGTVYLIPSNTAAGTLSLAAATTNQNILAEQFTLNTPGTLVPAFLGTSVGAYQPDLQRNTPPNTADGDSIPDLVFGAAGYAAPGPAAPRSAARRRRLLRRGGVPPRAPRADLQRRHLHLPDLGRHADDRSRSTPSARPPRPRCSIYVYGTATV